MQLQKCTMNDVAKLALLNKQLIEDEKLAVQAETGGADIEIS